VRARLAALAVALAACGGDAPIAAEDLLIRVEAADTADLGRAFPLAVVRTWNEELTPEPFAQDAFAPLALRPVGVVTRESGGRIEETRRYAAYAFRPGRFVVPAPQIAAAPRAGGAKRTASGAPLELLVRGALEPSSSAAPEMPGDPLDPPVRAWLWVGGATAAIATGLVLLRRRAVIRAEPPATPPPDPAAVALARLAALREHDAEHVEADFVAVAGILRTYLASRGVRVVERTSEEIVRELRARDDAQAGALAACLGPADLVKFAMSSPGPADRDALVARAESFVRGGTQ
jgi:hypothetical protein